MMPARSRWPRDLAIAIGVAASCTAIADPAPHAPVPPPEYWVVHGNVMDAQDKRPVAADIEITCRKPPQIEGDAREMTTWHGASDATGHFASTHSLRGDCTITVTASGYAAWVRTRSVRGPSDPIWVSLIAADANTRR